MLHIQRQSEALTTGSDAEGASRCLTIVLLFPGHMLTDHLPRGDGLVAFGFISALARRGHRLHVIAQRADIASPLPGNVQLYTAEGDSQDGPRESVSFLFRSRAIVRKIKSSETVDVVHQLNPVLNGMSLGMVGLNIPIVLGTFVSNWPAENSTGSAWARRFFKKAFDLARTMAYRMQERSASAFLVTTPAALSRFSSVERVSNRVHWLQNGIDVSALVPLPQTEASRYTILFLASLWKRKGIFTILEAFDIVRATLPQARLLIGGDGEEAAEVQRLVLARWPGGEVRILGRIDRGAVAHTMARCAVYCLPSFGEPYGMTVIEAMACGKPIVVTDAGGVRDLVTEAGGRKVEPGNARALAEALVEILSSPVLAAAMGAHNRSVAEQDFHWPAVIAKLEGVYEQVMAQNATL